MGRRRIVGLAACGAVVAMVFAAGAGAQTTPPLAPKDLVGVWEGSAQTPNGEVTLKVEFVAKDEKLTATIESSMGPLPVRSVTLTDEGIAMEIEAMSSAASLAATVNGKRMEGTWTLGANSGPFTLTKSAATDPAPKQ
jgi:hypothetical protein